MLNKCIGRLIAKTNRFLIDEVEACVTRELLNNNLKFYQDKVTR